MEMKNVGRFIRRPIGRRSLPDAGPVDRSAKAFRQAGARRTATRDRSGIYVGIRLAAKRRPAGRVGGRSRCRAKGLGRRHRGVGTGFARENREHLNPMSYIDTNARWGGLRPLAMHAVKAMHSIRMAYLRRRDRMQAYAELSSFDDLSLRDIGISRTEIKAAMHARNRDASRRPR